MGILKNKQIRPVYGYVLLAFLCLAGITLPCTAHASIWTYLAPRPTGNTIYDMYTPDGGATVYFVGDGGLILKKVGSKYTFMNTGTTAPLRGIHGNGPGNIWSVGGDGAAGTVSDPSRSVLLHFDGTSWTPTQPPQWEGWDGLYPMADVWTSPSGKAYAVSRDSSIPAKWNSTQNQWEFENVSDPNHILVNSCSLNAIFGFADDDIYAVGSYGTILHRDAWGWTPLVQFENTPSSMTFNLLQAVWGPDADHVFTCGNSGQVYRLIKSQSPTWEKVNQGGFIFTGYDLERMDGTGADNIWFVGAGGVIRQWNGTIDNLVVHDDPKAIGRNGILRTGANAYLLAGNKGLIENFDSTSATRQTLNTPVSVDTPWKAVAFGSSLWLAPQWTDPTVGIYAWDSGKMSKHAISDLPTNSMVMTFKAFSGSDMWLSVLDTNTFLGLTKRGDGTSWTTWTPPGTYGSTMPLLDVVKTADGGYAILQYHNGVGLPCVVGAESLTCLDSMKPESYNYLAMAASPNGDIHAVGKGGRVALWRNGSWTTSIVGSDGDDLTAVAATTNMIVTVGVNGCAFYTTNGTSWQPVSGITRIPPPQTDKPLQTFSAIVHAGSGGIFWAAMNTSSIYTDGGKGFLYRITNGKGERVEGGFSNPINSLASAPSQRAVFAAGDHGSIMTTNPSFHENTGGLPFLLLLED